MSSLPAASKTTNGVYAANVASFCDRIQKLLAADDPSAAAVPTAAISFAGVRSRLFGFDRRRSRFERPNRDRIGERGLKEKLGLGVRMRERGYENRINFALAEILGMREKNQEQDFGGYL